MERIRLTPRLRTIAEQVNNKAVLADIGTDHAFLPVSLILDGKIDFAIASDIGEGPLNSAKRTAEKYGVLDKISFRLGAGLDTLCSEDCDTIVIAGMGGENIRDILKCASFTKKGEHTLLLQPMSMVRELRFFLLNNGYAIENEYICPEGRRLYVILKVRGTNNKVEQKIPYYECVTSNSLLKAENATKYMNLILQREEKILNGLLDGQTIDENQVELSKKVIRHLKTKLLEVK